MNRHENRTQPHYRLFVGVVVLLTASFSFAPAAGAETWVQMPGRLKQISVGSRDHVWGVSKDGKIWRWTGKTWANVPGGLANVSVGGDGTVWGANPAGQVFRFWAGKWILKPGRIKQLSVGFHPWGVSADGKVWRLRTAAWEEMPGVAPCGCPHRLTNISIASDGDVWAPVWGLSATGVVHRWTAQRGNYGVGKWEVMPGDKRFKQISVGSKDHVWGVGEDDTVWRWSPKGWEQIKGRLKWVSVGRDGTVWGVNSDDIIWHWSDGTNVTPLAPFAGFPSGDTSRWPNVAKGKPARQSSVLQPQLYAAAKAVDGSREGTQSKITHTALEDFPWWEVDLGKSHWVSKIRIFNRTDCCDERLSYFEVLVSDVPIGAQGLTAAAGRANRRLLYRGKADKQTDIELNAPGRYVQIGLRGRGQLSLAEVEVLGVPGAKPLASPPKPGTLEWEIVPGASFGCGFFNIVGSVKKVSDCQALCQRRSQCVAFTWDQNKSTCKLQHEPGRRTDPVTFAGRRVWQRFRDKDFAGGDYRTLPNTASADACQAACDGENRCVAFTWNQRNRNCYLKDQADPQPRSISPGVATTGRRTWKSYPGSEFTGGDYRTVAKVPSAALCQVACERDKHVCLAFGWSPKSQSCVLKDRAGSQPKLVGSTVAGRKLGWRYGPGQDSTTLWMGQYWKSPNGRFKLVMMHDGNLVLFDLSTSRRIWETRTRAKPGETPRAALQTDGTFAVVGVVKTWGPVGKANSSRRAGGLKVRDDGNLQLFDGALRETGYIAWESKTQQPPIKAWHFWDTGVGRSPMFLRQIAVGSKDHVWGVDGGGGIWHRTAECGFVKDLGAPNLSSVGIPGLDPRLQQMRGRLVMEKPRIGKISVGSDGTVWAHNGFGRLFRQEGDAWKSVPGMLRQLSVGSKDHIWGINGKGEIVRWNGTAFAVVPGSLTSVSVASDGTVYGLDASGVAYRRDGTGWEKLANVYGDLRLRQISVGSRAHVWGVGPRGKVWKFQALRWLKCTAPTCVRERWKPPWVDVGTSMRWVSVGAGGFVAGVGGSGALWWQVAPTIR